MRLIKPRQIAVAPTEPTPGTEIASYYADPDYGDAFLVDADVCNCVEDFATSFFLSQPGWIARASMNLGPHDARRAVIGSGEYLEGSSVGSWEVHSRRANEIMFGEKMGFMEYRFSMMRRPDGRVEAATSVKYLKPFGHVYFAVVKPFHRAFVRIALRNAARHCVVRAL